MATNAKYNKMTSKKLNELLEKADNQQVIDEITDVLATRNASKKPTKAAEKAAEKSEAVAEKSEAEEEKEDDKSTDEKPAEEAKLTDKELEEKVIKLREELAGHTCSVVPFNTIDWRTGRVSGVIADKRSGNILVAIVLDDYKDKDGEAVEGKRIVKAYGSDLLKINEEMAKVPTRTRAAAPKLSPEELSERLAELAPNVGKKVKFDDFKTGEPVVGTIIRVFADERNMKVINRIKLDNGKTAHKTDGVEMEFTGEVDEELQAAFVKEEKERQELLNSPAKLAEHTKSRYDDALEELARVEKMVEARKQEYEEALAKLKESADEDEK